MRDWDHFVAEETHLEGREKLSSFPELTQLVSASAGITRNGLCPEPLSCVAEISSSDPVLNAGDSKGSKTQSLSLWSSARGQTQRQINRTWPICAVIEENMGWGG